MLYHVYRGAGTKIDRDGRHGISCVTVSAIAIESVKINARMHKEKASALHFRHKFWLLIKSAALALILTMPFDHNLTTKRIKRLDI